MFTSLVSITDQHHTMATVITHVQDVADNIRGWFPEAPADVTAAIERLQHELCTDSPCDATATYLAVTIEPVRKVEVVFPTRGHVNYIAETAAPNGRVQIDDDGHTATLNASALAVLANLSEDADGHFDGQHIWIQGTEYAVEAV